jgi:hypothetical protein
VRFVVADFSTNDIPVYSVDIPAIVIVEVLAVGLVLARHRAVDISLGHC